MPPRSPFKKVLVSTAGNSVSRKPSSVSSFRVCTHSSPHPMTEGGSRIKARPFWPNAGQLCCTIFTPEYPEGQLKLTTLRVVFTLHHQKKSRWMARRLSIVISIKSYGPLISFWTWNSVTEEVARYRATPWPSIHSVTALPFPKGPKDHLLR